MHFGRGLLAVASGDSAGARAHFDQCSRTDEWCKWEGVLAAEKAGDKAGATAARDTLLKLYFAQLDASHRSLAVDTADVVADVPCGRRLNI